MRVSFHSPAKLTLRLLLPFFLLAAALPGQGPVATKAGLIYLAEGAVLVNGEPLTPGEGQLLFVEEGGTISTAGGRAELLIGSASYLRLAENTSVHMLSADLSEVELKLEAGVVILDVAKSSPDNPITLHCASSKLETGRRGVYRVEHTSATRLKVFDGRAQVRTPVDHNLLSAGWMMNLGADPPASAPQKFRRKQKDGFDLWSAHRSAQLAKLRRTQRGDSATLGGELQPLYTPQTSPRAKRFPDGSN